ncbi:MAG: tetratricopeptide repeat protein [Pseudorhodoplanes sp.]|uniref:tetratricopeptide repeat protein n=1 Tax=Pseudorhodoplanes sp. TaxID=1934341 RepID=UPI003D09D8F7
MQIALIVTCVAARQASGLAGPAEDAEAAYRRGDVGKAIEIARQAAERSDPQAQAVLAFFLYTKVPPDPVEAMMWWRRSAEQGHAEGQFMLATQYFYGVATPPDYGAAYKWALVAARSPDLSEAARNEVLKLAGEIRARLGPEQIKAAQEEAVAFHPKRER